MVHLIPKNVENKTSSVKAHLVFPDPPGDIDCSSDIELKPEPMAIRDLNLTKVTGGIRDNKPFSLSGHRKAERLNQNWSNGDTSSQCPGMKMRNTKMKEGWRGRKDMRL